MNITDKRLMPTVIETAKARPGQVYGLGKLFYICGVDTVTERVWFTRLEDGSAIPLEAMPRYLDYVEAEVVVFK